MSKNFPPGSGRIEVITDSGSKLYLDISGEALMNYAHMRKFDGVFKLTGGEHFIRVYFSGSSSSDEILIDYFIIQPTLERKIFLSPSGDKVKLERRIVKERVKE
jgi:hypothetical protein